MDEIKEEIINTDIINEEDNDIIKIDKADFYKDNVIEINKADYYKDKENIDNEEIQNNDNIENTNNKDNKDIKDNTNNKENNEITNNDNQNNKYNKYMKYYKYKNKINNEDNTNENNKENNTKENNNNNIEENNYKSIDNTNKYHDKGKSTELEINLQTPITKKENNSFNNSISNNPKIFKDTLLITPIVEDKNQMSIERSNDMIFNFDEDENNNKSNMTNIFSCSNINRSSTNNNINKNNEDYIIISDNNEEDIPEQINKTTYNYHSNRQNHRSMYDDRSFEDYYNTSNIIPNTESREGKKSKFSCKYHVNKNPNYSFYSQRPENINKRFPKKYTSSYVNSDNNHEKFFEYKDNKNQKKKHFYNREDDEYRTMNPLKYLKHSFQRKQEFKFGFDDGGFEDEFFKDDFFKFGSDDDNYMKTESKTIREKKRDNYNKFGEEIRQVFNVFPRSFKRNNDTNKGRMEILQELLKNKKKKCSKSGDKDDNNYENENGNGKKFNSSDKKYNDDEVSDSFYSIRNKYKRKEK